MEKCAQTLLAFPGEVRFPGYAIYDQDVKLHLANITRLLKERSSDLIAYGPELLDLLDPFVNSLSYLAVLHTLILPSLAESAPREKLLEKLCLFMVSFDGIQVRYAGSHLHDLFTAVGNGQLLPPAAAVEVLASGILRVDPTGSMLTSPHILLAKLAYQTDNMKPALRVINKDITFYPGMSNYREAQYLCAVDLAPPAYISRETALTSVLKPSAVMEYDLLCGMIFCAQGSWEEALWAFERVVTFPTREAATSKIMVEAYKKYVLVSLLELGQLPELPPHTNSVTSKQYLILSKPYTAVAALFPTNKAQQLKEETEKHGQVWLEDGNSGLIQEVLSAYQKWQIWKLCRVYSKVSIAEIGQQTQSAETGLPLPSNEDVEMLIQNMIIAGMLRGVIEKNDDGTKFLDFSPAAQISEQEFAQRLASTMGRLKQLQPIVKSTNERLVTHKDYIKHVIKDKKRGDKSEPFDQAMGFQNEVDDEDLMSGIIATG